MPPSEQFRNGRREPPDNREKEKPWTKFLFPRPFRRFTKIRYIIPPILAFLIIVVVHQMLVQNSPEAYFERGRIHAENGAYDRAIVELTQALERNAVNANFHAWRGLAYCYKSDYETAITDLSNAITLNPDYREAYAMRAVAYAEMKDYPNAVSDFDQARALKASEQTGDANQQIPDSLSESELHTSRFGQTYMELEKLSKYNEEFLQPFLKRAEALKQREREQREAGRDPLAGLNEHFGMKTAEIYAYFERGRAYVENGDYDRAIVELTQAIELTESAKRDPFRAEFYAWRGLAYHYKGYYDYAMRNLSIATVWKGNDYSEAFAVRAEIALKIKDYSSAVRHFREAKARKKARQEGDSTQGLSDSMSISYTHTPRFRQTYMELVEQEELYKLYEPPWTYLKMLKRFEIRKKKEREWREREQREAGKSRLEVLNERLEENPYSLENLWDRLNYYEKIGEEEKARRDRKRYYRLGGYKR